jgi:hypothetical protein
VVLDIFILSFSIFSTKKEINSTKSGCEGQPTEIIFSGVKNPSDFFIEYHSKAVAKSGTDPL